MYKNFIIPISLLLAISLLLVGCKGNGNSAVNNNGKSTSDNTPATSDTSVYDEPFNIPENLMSEAKYRAEVDRLTSESGYSDADDAYIANVDNIRTGLYNMITYNQSAAEYTGTAYYVSNKGNDNNDGLPPTPRGQVLTR